MGCGLSRPVLDDDDSPPPAGLSPIRRRIEEIKRNRKVHKRSKSHLSSKKLLHDQSVVDEDEEYVSCHLESIEEVENQGTPKHNHLVDKKQVMNESPAPARAHAENVVVYNNVNVVVYGNNVNVVAEKKIEEREEEKQHHVQEEKQHQVQEENQHHVQEEKQHQDQEENQHHVQEEKQDVEKVEKEEQDQEEIIDGLEDGYGSDFFPGSPSFREYCVFSADKDDDDDEEEEEEEEEVCKDGSNGVQETCAGNGDGEKREETTQRDESTESDEGPVTVLAKKEHKGRKFKRILPKGGQAAVKNLMNVKSCYIPPCSNFQNRPARLPPPTSA
ncbi:hypothetical protein FRX31_010915 [Thalictrum thalictroides]|uniref:Uncharacterized protein n=1 Tax=Thalictrum thalictroides TaxID=46969 RepID=A0A7J6WRG3_THATH|nr:hypothetical protein FRX31_010915 [Thalictrum thalictroides]